MINFVAAPGAGKSLMSAMIFAELKMRHYSAEMVQEYAKNLVWQGRLEELNCQWMVSMEQYRMLKAVNEKVEYICTDSPLLIGMYYNRTHGNNVCDVVKTEAMIASKMNEFDNVYIYLKRNWEFPFETEGRIHTEEESIHIEDGLKYLLDEYGIRYLEVTSSRDSIQKILEYILASPENDIAIGYC